MGAIVLCPGFEEFDARVKSEFGYGRHKNVLTSLEFERMLSHNGPPQSCLLRPSDKREPKKIAWINCVGSRDIAGGNNYCSSVCCSFSIKETVLAKERVPAIEPTIFYIDMRTFGKGLEPYWQRAKDEHGIRSVRCRVPAVDEDPETHNLMIRYVNEDDALKEEVFDMVVLSTGFQPSDEIKGFAEKFGIKLNDHGYCETSELSPVETSRPGIFTCGTFSEPKDVSETVIEASSAAADASGLIASQRNDLIEIEEYPPEIDVIGEIPRIGVFICSCGTNIGAHVDIPSVVEYAKTLSNVAYAENNLYTCSKDTRRKIVEKIKEHALTRVIVAAGTPRTHEQLFQRTIREAGLNPHLIEMVNIRDQCSLVHMNEPEKATKKAKDLVRMAAAKAGLLVPVPTIFSDVVRKALVIGGGLAGMISALAIAEQGFEVYLIEKEEILGGNLRHIHYTIENKDIQGYLEAIIKKVDENNLIKVYKNSQVKNIEGYVGNYTTSIDSGSTDIELEHGVIIVATGAKESAPKEYLCGEEVNVITQLGLEKQLAEGKDFDE
ncbi:MAG: CoB--CoM heterodisulfide reductase iron-sulfur subunit A family protein, partial [Thermoplasmata archaeon]|nr:CoB--CoM heterodisulfide reductase iron-sulfur subunit A family protein [Thermoplasmata archaeon]